jgi:tryptophan synthase alpha chain
MNRIETLCRNKKDILSVYFTAGFPGLHDTRDMIQHLVEAGVDMIEIGIPFSDPLADGPVIQHSSEVALKNGMTLALLFDQLAGVRNRHPETPFILMGYLNPVMQYGVENFCRKARECGIDGVILPDMPLQEYLDEYQHIFQQYGIIPVFLITPQTSDARIRLIDSHSKGFVYMVSSASTTGGTSVMAVESEAYFERVKSLKLKTPLIIGFGISNSSSFENACKHASGAIIGSAFIRAVQQSADLKSDILKFVRSIKQQQKKTTV